MAKKFESPLHKALNSIKETTPASAATKIFRHYSSNKMIAFEESV